MDTQRILVVLMAGLGYGSDDISGSTGVKQQDCAKLRQSNHKLIRDLKARKQEARHILLQYQQDNAMCRGYVLTLNQDITPRDLRQVASTAAILAKSIGANEPATPVTPPAAPARPSSESQTVAKP